MGGRCEAKATFPPKCWFHHLVWFVCRFYVSKQLRQHSELVRSVYGGWHCWVSNYTTACTNLVVNQKASLLGHTTQPDQSQRV